MVVLVMGVSGVGKSTVGQSLAASLNWEFVDADSFHSPDNIAKMSHGIPLGSRDRMPWLFSLQNTIEHWLETKHHAVLACSALKSAYRNLLISDRTQIKLVYLYSSFELIYQRLQKRQQHFMSPGLLRSQFETLEEPTAEEAIYIDAAESLPVILNQIRQHLRI